MISLPVARAVPSDEQRGRRPERGQLQKVVRAVVTCEEKRYFPLPVGGTGQDFPKVLREKQDTLTVVPSLGGHHSAASSWVNLPCRALWA